MNRFRKDNPSTVNRIDGGCKLNGDYVAQTHDERRLNLIKSKRFDDFRR